MSIYRGDGGAGNADDDATVNAVAANAVAAASSAAEAAVSEANAAISAAFANTKANEAAVSAASASTASASASAAASSETNAAASAASAATSAANAASVVGSGNGVFTVPVSYTSTLTGGTGIVNLGSGQFYKDASGNLGVGVTPSAWTTGYKAFQLGATSALSDNSGNSSYWNNIVVTGAGTATYQTTAAASFYRQSSGTHSWWVAPSGTAGTAASVAQVMGLDVSGNVAIGSGSANGKLEVTSGTSPNAAHMVIGYLGTSYNYFDGNTHSFRNGAYAEQLRVSSTASAVNYTQITGGATGTAVGVSAQGSDANIDITLTPKGTGRVNIATSIKPKVSSTTSVASPLAWNSTSFDEYALTALNNALTISADANTSPADGQKMLFRFKDNGIPRALTWTTGATRAFRAIGVILPTTTVVSKLVYIGCVYNAADARWDVLIVGQEA